MVHAGGCACGALRYEVRGTPFHETLCHCIDCRKAAGAPAVAWFSVRAEELVFVTGTPAVHRSSPPVERAFCVRCGTQLSYRHDRYPDEVDVTTCSLDEPAALPPRDHTFTSQRLPWLSVSDGLPRYPRRRSEGTDGA